MPLNMPVESWDDFVFAVGANVHSTCIQAPRNEGVYNEPSVSFDSDGSVWVTGAHGSVRLFKNCPVSLMYQMYMQRFDEFIGEKK